nr:MAG TPA: hypothetical protein [Inoviridae sp.]
MIALDVARNHCSQGGELPTLDRLQYPASTKEKREKERRYRKRQKR